ncbi:erythromycin esterase family protein [Hymenobacter sp. ASUV-10]|uniref:Erythromycin esterase family protein n=1 Tax=Hymenobacter aranciens TaxID=3063996 RepID=A0ABT9BAT9_9BACT|nr:erythromycin esterase family protein [Hymenobacter sp. ASUV-10]MDO7875385.1 erythromycin esterase family protein [Hymenobacter sp. ASUV-10]
MTTWASSAQTAGSTTAGPDFGGVPLAAVPLAAEGTFPAFEDSFYQNQLFLLGEAHGVQRPQDVDFALLRHLNERAGVRTYMAEIDCAKAYYLNEYLRTGDEKTLDLVFRSWIAANSQWANNDYRAKLQRIRTWNLTLPQRRQVRFVGIDEVQDAALAADYLNALMQGQKLTGDLRSQLDSVAVLLRQQTGDPEAVAQRALLTLQQPMTNRKKLGSRYDDLRLLLRNLTWAQRGVKGREQTLFSNYQDLIATPELAGKKLYGMWGLWHVLQSPLQNGALSFAGMVRQSKLPAHDKVVSVLCVFAGCQMLMPNSSLPAAWQAPGKHYVVTDKFSHDGPLVVLAGMDELKRRTAAGSTTLFRLGAAAGKQSIGVRYAPGVPVAQQLQFRPELPATDYVQYLVLVRDSGPVQPLRP